MDAFETEAAALYAAPMKLDEMRDFAARLVKADDKTASVTARRQASSPYDIHCLRPCQKTGLATKVPLSTSGKEACYPAKASEFGQAIHTRKQ